MAKIISMLLTSGISEHSYRLLLLESAAYCRAGKMPTALVCATWSAVLNALSESIRLLLPTVETR